VKIGGEKFDWGAKVLTFGQIAKYWRIYSFPSPCCGQSQVLMQLYKSLLPIGFVA
jgi:hypothetical protein